MGDNGRAGRSPVFPGRHTAGTHMSSDPVAFFDTTLRDGEQSPGASMNTDEKLEITRQLLRLKVDIIEAGFPISSPGDFESVKRIAAGCQNPLTRKGSHALDVLHSR